MPKETKLRRLKLRQCDYCNEIYDSIPKKKRGFLFTRGSLKDRFHSICANADLDNKKKTYLSPSYHSVGALHVTKLCKKCKSIKTVNDWLSVFNIRDLMLHVYGRRNGIAFIKSKKECLISRASCLIDLLISSNPTNYTQIVLMDGHGRLMHYIFQILKKRHNALIKLGLTKINFVLVDSEPSVVEYHKIVLRNNLKCGLLTLTFTHVNQDVIQYLNQIDDRYKKNILPYLNFCGFGDSAKDLHLIPKKFSKWMISGSIDSRNKILQGKTFPEYFAELIGKENTGKYKQIDKSNFYTFYSKI